MPENTTTSENTRGQAEQPQNSRLFNPNEHLMQIKNRGGSADYLPVQWRLVWFRSLCPNGTIETEIVHLDLDRETQEETYAWNNATRQSEKVIKRAPGFAIFRAVVKDGNGGVGMGTKSEKAASFPDYIEKAETGAIGRALSALGYGTQFAGDEFDERHRIVDAPVDRGSAAPENNAQAPRALANGKGNERAAARTFTPLAATPIDPDANGPSTSQQQESLAKLYQRLNKTAPQGIENLTYLAAKERIAQLSQEYRESRQKAG